VLLAEVCGQGGVVEEGLAALAEALTVTTRGWRLEWPRRGSLSRARVNSPGGRQGRSAEACAPLPAAGDAGVRAIVGRSPEELDAVAYQRARWRRAQPACM
jgi:hypothetical protein